METKNWLTENLSNPATIGLFAAIAGVLTKYITGFNIGVAGNLKSTIKIFALVTASGAIVNLSTKETNKPE